MKVRSRTTSGALLRFGRYWLPVGTMTLLSIVSYVDRNVLALLAPTILRETGLTAQQYGYMISAFSTAYLIGNPVWGMALDRFGLRAGLAISVALWTGSSVCHALATTALGFSAARALLGFGEGATFPGGLRAAVQTLRPSHRARGIAIAYGGGSIGAIAAPLLVTPVALRWGWRGAFVATGVLGAVWLVLWAITGLDVRLRRRRRRSAGARPRLQEPSILRFVAAYAFGGLPLGFVLYGAPIHLGRELGFDQSQLGHVLWIPPLGWEVGYLFWAWVVDRTSRSVAPPSFGPLFGVLAVLSVPLASAGVSRSGPVVLALMFLAMFASAGFVIVSLAEVTRGRAGHGAYLAGLGAGAWSALMAIVMPAFGRLFDRGAFALAYVVAASSPVAGYAIQQLLRYLDSPPSASAASTYR